MHEVCIILEPSTSALLATSTHPLLFSGASLPKDAFIRSDLQGNLKDGSRLCAATEAYIMFSLSPAIVLFRKIPVYRDSGLVQSERSPPAEVTVSSPLTACGSKGICLSLSLLPASDLNSKAAEGGRAACVMCKHIAHSVRWGRVCLHRPRRRGVAPPGSLGSNPAHSENLRVL